MICTGYPPSSISGNLQRSFIERQKLDEGKAKSRWVELVKK